MDKIKVFGNTAREIESGQIFRAIKDSVEGRDVVILEPVILFDKDGVPSYKVELEWITHTMMKLTADTQELVELVESIVIQYQMMMV